MWNPNCILALFIAYDCFLLGLWVWHSKFLILMEFQLKWITLTLLQMKSHQSVELLKLNLMFFVVVFWMQKIMLVASTVFYYLDGNPGNFFQTNKAKICPKYNCIKKNGTFISTDLLPIGYLHRILHLLRI